MTFIYNKSPDYLGAYRGTFTNIYRDIIFNKRPSDVLTDVHTDVHTDVLTDVHTDVHTDVYTESRNAPDALKSKISLLRFRCTEREVCSLNIS